LGHGKDSSASVAPALEAAAAKELLESKARLELATEAAGIGIWDWDVTTDDMTYSPRASVICGFAADQPITFEDARRVTHPDDFPRTSAMAGRALDPHLRERAPYQYRVVRADGEVRWVLAQGEAIFAETDGVERLRLHDSPGTARPRHRWRDPARLDARTAASGRRRAVLHPRRNGRHGPHAQGRRADANFPRHPDRRRGSRLV
jgi:PAS domain S-box-containing protein